MNKWYISISAKKKKAFVEGARGLHYVELKLYIKLWKRHVDADNGQNKSTWTYGKFNSSFFSNSPNQNVDQSVSAVLF